MHIWFGICIALSTVGISVAQNSFYPQNNRWPRQDGGSSCLTPDRRPGSCLNIRQCTVLRDMLRNSGPTSEVRDLLQKSKCNVQRSVSDVCCPNVDTRNTPSPGDTLQDRFWNLMSPPQCGKTFVNQQTRIVGGTPAELGAWPWMALLGYRTRRKPGPFWQCGGALITERHVLTAAHCVSTSSVGFELYTVRLGENEIQNENDGANPIDVLVDRTIPHPNYKNGKKNDDIALVRLSQPVTFTRLIQPICLPKQEEMRSHTFAKYYPFAAGWGAVGVGGPSSTKLLQVQVPVVENESCNRAYTQKGEPIRSNQICAGYPNGGKDACQGDSGGPLMLPSGSSYYLIGVVSFGFKCAEAGYPGVYTRVTAYLDWISSNMK